MPPGGSLALVRNAARRVVCAGRLFLRQPMLPHPLPIGRPDSEAATERFEADPKMERDGAPGGRRAVKACQTSECKIARQAAEMLNRIHVVNPESMQAFFDALKDRVHDEVCAQAACEDDRL